MKRYPKQRPYLTVHWCFPHARREWSDKACPAEYRARLDLNARVKGAA